LAVRALAPIRELHSSHLSWPDAPQARATREEALEITRGLIERLLVKPGEARGNFEVEMEGEIAAMVELAQVPTSANTKAA
jgi:hypothetical protein